MVLQLPRLTFARFAAQAALAAALAATLALAGCGRKPGGLDEPPLAAAGDVQQSGPYGTAAAPRSNLGPDGKPLAPPVEKRKTFLDWLID
ncbi:MAG TPA: hypothetical protein VIY51_01430 [Xanthobacteraceae bacterium]